MKSAGAAVPARHYADLQWLRGIAAFLVVLEHLKNEMMFRLQGLDPESSYSLIFPFPAGVDVFFVISGFVIAHSSSKLFGVKEGRRVFLLRRLARIVPLYWLLTILFLVLLWGAGSRLSEGLSPAYLAGSFLFVPMANLDGVPLPVLPLGWTLNYEIMFYALFAAAIGLPRRVALTTVLAGLVAIALAGWIWQPANLQLRFWSDPIILEFAAGIVIQMICARGFALPDPVRLVLVLLAVVILALVGLPADLYADRWLYWGGPAALIVLAAASGGRGRANGIADAVGDTSYAVYLAHLFVLIALSRVFLGLGATGPLAVYLIYPVAAVILVALSAAALHYGFERPMLARLRERIDRR